MRILLTGATGQVGREVLQFVAGQHEVLAPARSELDLAKPAQVRLAIRDMKPAVIINAGAWTAVDLAESRGAEAMAINAEAVAAVGEEAARLHARVIHFSTDYVYD